MRRRELENALRLSMVSESETMRIAFGISRFMAANAAVYQELRPY
jgi:hypothetical protein